MGDELAAQIAAETNAERKHALIHALRPPFSDDVLDVLAEALADDRVVVLCDGYYDERDLVSHEARRVFRQAGARIEPVVAGKLDDPSHDCRDLALSLLAELPALSAGTIDAILRLAVDPRHAYAAGCALAGKLDARPLLDFSETRLAGLVATRDLEPAWLAELLRDDNAQVRLRTLGRIVGLAPPAHELVPAILPLLDDPDPLISAMAVRTLAPLRPDDPLVTDAMFGASRGHERRGELLAALAKRPGAHLVPYAPELVTRLRGGDGSVLRLLGALGSGAPAEVALALGRELRRTRCPVELVLSALVRLGPAALPALSMIDAAAQRHANAEAREAAGQLAATLRSSSRS